MSIAEEIRDRLMAELVPDHLEVVDDSERHRGHSGWREGGKTHLRVTISAPALAPLSRIERHRAIHRALGPDLVARIHALALDIRV
ncbi:BolA family protein [Rhodovulum sp.]|uniref:BolA family protein n=1 Tax=Rhodovulum sp. TaxID=34009 RepID=UPI00184D5B78|nr:BolA family protein [Rhodovulum sp.]HDR27409.1 BolA family transcriptional regulator [Rhodovulum sp.]